MSAAQLRLAVQRAVPAAADLPSRSQWLRWCRAALDAAAAPAGAEITIRLVDEVEGQTLNRDYRGKDYPTNVLTFCYDDTAPLPGMPLLGDLVLCLPVVRREADEQGKTLEAHLAHLVVHGMRHLQGEDHETEAEAACMEAKETAILMALGYDDPYRLHQP